MTTATKEVKPQAQNIAVKQEVLDMSEKLRQHAKIDPKTGEITGLTAATYVSLLPADVTEEQAKSLQVHHATMVAAAAHAVGHLAIPVMKKQKDIDKVSMVIPMIGKDFLAVDFDRSRQVPARDADNNPSGTKTKFGSVSVNYEVYGTGTRGQLKAVKQELSELATAAFGK
jgi:hypothetical protein